MSGISWQEANEMVIQQHRRDEHDRIWNAVLNSKELEPTRRKLSVHELRLLIRTITEA